VKQSFLTCPSEAFDGHAARAAESFGHARARPNSRTFALATADALARAEWQLNGQARSGRAAREEGGECGVDARVLTHIRHVQPEQEQLAQPDTMLREARTQPH
jgi:hypothetical protein